MSNVVQRTDGQTAEFATSIYTYPMYWNGVTWDLGRGNLNGTAISAASRTAGTVESSDIVNYDHRGAHVFVHRSVGNAHLVATVQGKDALSGRYYNLLTTATMSGTGGAAFILYPGVSAGSATAPATGGQRSEALPRTWRVMVVPSTSPTSSWGVGYSMIK